MGPSIIDDNLFLVTSSLDWYAGIVEFLTTQRLLVEWTKDERKKVRVNSRHFAVIGNRLFRRGADGIIKRCMSEAKVLDILTSCHDSACGGNFLGELTGQKILRTRYFWPTMLIDSHAYGEHATFVSVTHGMT